MRKFTLFFCAILLAMIGYSYSSSSFANLGTTLRDGNESPDLHQAGISLKVADTKNSLISMLPMETEVILLCEAPLNISISRKTSISVDIRWDAAQSQTNWIIIYGSVGFDPHTTGTSVQVSSSATTLNGLSPNTPYEVYVKAQCGGTDGSDDSLFTGPVSFNTECEPATIVYTLDFENLTIPNLPNCTSTENVGQGNDWETATPSPYRGYTGNVLRYKGHMEHDANTWFFTQGVELTADVGYQIHYKYGSYGFVERLAVGFGTSAEALAMTNLLADNQTGLNDSIYQAAVFFRVDTDDVYYFGFNARSQAENYLLFLDDISIVEAPSCMPPTALRFVSATTTTAAISWTAGDREANWLIKYGEVGFDPDTAGTSLSVTSLSTTLIDLSPNTTYEVYVKSRCGSADGTDDSPFTGPLSFTTECVPATLPYFEDFENITPPNLPECTSIGNGGSWERWKTVLPNSNLGYTGNVLHSNSTSSFASDTWFFTQGVELVANVDYQISYKFGDDGRVEKLKVGFGPSAQISAMTTTLADHTTNGNKAISNPNHYFSVDTDGVYFFGFYGHSDPNSSRLYLDDISITEVESCIAPTDLTFVSSTTTTADIYWTAGNLETEWVVKYGAPGFNPDIEGISATVRDLPNTQLTGLASGKIYEAYVKAICSSNDHSVFSTNLISFFTFPANDDLCDAIPLILESTSASDEYLNMGATAEYNEPNGACWGGGDNAQMTVWFYFEAPSSGNVTVTTNFYGGSLNNTQLAIYEAPQDCTDLLTLGAQVGCGEDEDGSLKARITTTGLTAGETYYIQVDGYSAVSGTFGIEVRDNGYDGYIYEAGAWTPMNPNNNATASDNITVKDGIANFTHDIEVNNIAILRDATLNVEHMLAINGDITNYGNMIFKSTEISNGELAEVPNGSIVNGDITVESYMSHNRSYRMVSSAVTTETSIHDNWQEVATSNTHDPNPGFGTHITGSIQDQENGFDGTATGSSSMFYLPDGTQSFAAIDNTDTNKLTAGVPYLLFVRGDRSIVLSDNNAVSSTTLRAKGRLHVGADTQSFNTVNAGDYVMFGNPYQSAVNIISVFENSTNINDEHYYVYDPSQGDYGAYVTVSLPMGSTTGTSSANQFLQPGQGAQVATSSNGISAIVFNENNKAPSNFTTTSAWDNRLSSDNMLTVQLFTTENFNNYGPTHDSFGIIFGDGLDNELTSADATKPMNFHENLGIDHNGTYLSLERRAMPQPSEVYPLYSTGYNHVNYTLKIIMDGLEETFLYLDDHFLGTSMLLESRGTVYNFSVDPNDELSIATNRFSIRVEQRLNVDDNGLFSGVRLFPNPLYDNIFYIQAPKLNGEQILVSISDLTGRQIFEDMLECDENKIRVSVSDNLSSGVYMVTLRHGGKENTYRLIKSAIAK